MISCMYGIEIEMKDESPKPTMMVYVPRNGVVFNLGRCGNMSLLMSWQIFNQEAYENWLNNAV